MVYLLDFSAASGNLLKLMLVVLGIAVPASVSVLPRHRIVVARIDLKRFSSFERGQFAVPRTC